jgi:hypothetical protein
MSQSFLKITLVFTFLILLVSKTYAAVEIGAGTNSFTAGRFVPSLDIAYSGADKAIALSSTGVRNFYYYQSSYLLAYYKVWKVGSLLGGNVNSGFGAAAGYSVRSFKDDGSSSTATTASDIILGPSARMNLAFGFVYLNMAATYGLKNLDTHLSGLTFQDITSVSIGVRF